MNKPIIKIEVSVDRAIEQLDEAMSKVIKYQRVVDFMNLFTQEEKDSWVNKDGFRIAPDWVTQGIVWIMNQDSSHQDLMKRLQDS